MPYKEEFIDLENKPQWLLDVNPKGTVPVIHDLEKDKWVPGAHACRCSSCINTYLAADCATLTANRARTLIVTFLYNRLGACKVHTSRNAGQTHS